MIRRPKEIYLKVAEKHELPIDLIMSIGNTVFEETTQTLNNPTELAYELPEIGTFNIRFKRLENYLLNFEKLIEAGEQKYIEMLEKNPELYARVKLLYSKIEQYRKDKKETKQKRNEQNNTIESSEDNLEEH